LDVSQQKAKLKNAGITQRDPKDVHSWTVEEGKTKQNKTKQNKQKNTHTKHHQNKTTK
jgi:hypothetical protein